MEGVDRPDDPKANAMYRLDIGGMSVCHMGDVGRGLTDEQLTGLRGRVDVLLALAGAGLTISLEDLDDAIAEISPSIVIPMHYRTPSLLYDAGPLSDFLERRGKDTVVRHESATVDLEPSMLRNGLTIHVLKPSQDALVSA
jgi:L-ascorbate metabolism protein UlaG (beta-lactamase superfamily)